MDSLKLLSKYNNLTKILELTKEYSNKLDLVFAIHAYFENDIISNVVRSLESKVKNIYEEYKFDRTLFVKNAAKTLGIKEDDFVYYPYYAIPISQETKVKFVDNSTIPPKALITKGVVRFTFMAYKSFQELDYRIASREEEDIVIEFENGKIKSHSRKRNIFTDANVVSKILSSNKEVILNLTLPDSYYLIPSLISMNVFPYGNEVLITREGESLDFRILNGKASNDKVVMGETLHPRFKLELYYDYKSKRILKEDMARGLAYKIPS
ncbi:MAG: hypothetical protein QXY87_02375 [Saccharolobus sp.]|uniref:Uncharacterized protein n=1 Tax=Saccharolobus shibatae (strain ATCC 51178 / DSM 5389 / JCM 8931 / NBRC 15437 / B12) TaxID=523848 RepID=A0A8F5BL61_SACSH|nr:hypothetical protein [Saccharolobus shibatae]MCH4814244.1 hypothetical protein [Saccharolobus shibatae]QXJ27352.1 Uncharacterized protein J5U23_00219 [Saccharolobus shibatae B12]